jgi:MHS family proline/betaine transporter-like MFS transporter
MVGLAIVYGIFAPYVAKSFFPTGSGAMSMIATFAAFAVGYVARPLGGLVLSHFGDRFGRRAAFQLSLVVMTMTTAGMALMPTYESIGVIASIAFVAAVSVVGLLSVVATIVGRTRAPVRSSQVAAEEG